MTASAVSPPAARQTAAGSVNSAQGQPLFRVLDLFSGIGGFSLGLERTGGFKTVAFCEIEPFCRKVLAKHWPDVPIYEDVRTLSADTLSRDGIGVDVICGGFPCQDISAAGCGEGLDGERSGLWYQFDRLIGEINPQFVVIENVDRLAGNGLDGVLRSLAAKGLDAEWDTLPGWLVGAPQARKRMWVVAHAPCIGMEGLFAGVRACSVGQGWAGSAAHLLDFAAFALVGNHRFPQPLLRGMDDRPANWVDRVRACGNAVIPQIVELIGDAILDSERMAA